MTIFLSLLFVLRCHCHDRNDPTLTYLLTASHKGHEIERVVLRSQIFASVVDCRLPLSGRQHVKTAAKAFWFWFLVLLCEVGMRYGRKNTPVSTS